MGRCVPLLCRRNQLQQRAADAAVLYVVWCVAGTAVCIGMASEQEDGAGRGKAELFPRTILRFLKYACLLDGLIVFSYFQFLDDGLLMEQLNALLTQPEMAKTYEQMGMEVQHAQMLEILAEVDGLSAWEKTLVIFNNNFVFSLVLSLVVAWVASWSRPHVGRNSN